MAGKKIELEDLNDAVGKVVRWKFRPFFAILGNEYLEDTERRVYAVYRESTWIIGRVWRGGVLSTLGGDFHRLNVRTRGATRATIRAIADVSKLGNVEICRDSANRTIDDESLLGDVEIHQGSADQVFRLGDDVFEIRKVVKGILHPTMAILDGSGELLRSEWGWEQAEVEVLGQHALLPLLATVLKWTLTND